MKHLLSLMLSTLLTLHLAAQQQIVLSTDPEAANKLLMAVGYINTFYVDSVNNNKLAEDAIRGILKELDPHSSYTNAEETRKAEEPLLGNFDGIGVVFNVVEDTVVVIQTIAGGPSERMGVVTGDRICNVNGTTISGVKMERTDMMKQMRGPRGTIAKLGIKRGDDTTLVYIDVTRDKIPLNTVETAYMIRPSIGYLRISSFGSHTGEEVGQALDSLSKHGMKKLILDLTQNGGGFLTAAQDVASYFLNKGDLIVSTQGRSVQSETLLAKSIDGHHRFKGDLIVLIDEYTASAAEIVAGAVQDHDRGIIVGRRSFGKGLVQRPCRLPDGSMMRLTVSHYYTPSGRCIQKPYEKGHTDDYAKDIERRLKSGELTCRDSIHFSPEQTHYTLHKKRTVYAGGGIMPDTFVPLDTTKHNAYHRQLLQKNCIITTAIKYAQAHREELRSTYPTLTSFAEGYQPDHTLWDLLDQEAAKANITPKDAEEQQTTKRTAAWELKALIARDLYGIEAHYRIWNEQSDIIKAALSHYLSLK